MTSRSAAGAMTLPGEYYTSEKIYLLESSKIFSRNWLYAGRLADLDQPGSYLLREVENESIILLQNHENKARAFYNVCRHRGTRICKENQGRFSRSIQCPYHAWTYNLNGELIGAPNMESVQGFRKESFPLIEVPLAVWEGGLFINLAEQPVPFETAYAPLKNKFAEWSLSELKTAHHLTYDVKANWKLILQNYSECYHCPTLHPDLNRLTPYRNSSNDLEEGPFLGGPMYLSAGNESMTMSGKRCAPLLPHLSAANTGCIYYYVIFPNFLLSLHPDYVLVHRLERLAVDRTRIACDWLFHPQAMDMPGFDPSDAVKFWNMTNLQDWEVSELSQQGISSKVYSPGPYADLESMIAALDQHYLAQLL